MYRDITERKQDEQLHQVLYNISKAANSVLSLDQLYPLIHQELGSIIDTTNFYIALVDEKKDKIFFPYNIDNTKPIHLPRTINHNSLVAQVIRTGKSIFVNREMIKGKKFMMEFKEWFGMLRKVWLGVPLKVEDRVIGAIVVQSYTNPELYSEKDIKLLEFVSSQVATALDRKKAEETLKKSQQEFASLFNSSPQAAIYHDEKGIILNINPRFTELFGYTLEEVKGKNINQGMIFPQDKTREESERLTKLALEGSIVGYETIRKKKDGTLIPVIISTSSVITKEQNKGIIAFYQDITKQNNILEKLKESEEKYRSLFENMPGGYYRADKDGKVIIMNPPGAKLLGCNSPEEIIGKNLAQDLYYIPEDRKRFLEELKKRKGSVKDYGVTLKKRDGTPVIVSTSSHYYYDEEGNIAGVEGIFVDITERKQDEQLHQVLYNISKAANSVLSLDQLYPLIHQELGSIIDTTNFYIALIDEKEDKIFFPYHVDEKDDNFPIINFSTANTLTAYVIKNGQPLLNDNNQYKEMIAQGILSPWGSTTPQSIWLGVPLKIEDKTIGVMVVQSYTHPHLYSEKDIKLLEFVSSQVATALERKKAEETLQKSQQEFASLFMNSPEALIYIDEKGTILNINPRFTKLFGYTLEEIKGKNINEGFIHPPDKIKEGKNLDKIALSKGYFNYETIRKKKDGTLFPVSIASSNIKIDGQTKGLIATYIDITERKRLEKKLEKLAHFDVLTGCYARGYGLSLFERQMKSAQRHKTSILLLYVDLDVLKYINDTFGHKEGDKVLKEAAKFFKSTLREIDIICRMGGDEFLLIFPDSSLDDVPLIKERITNKLKELNENLNNPYKISFSIGLSCYNPSDPLSIEELIKIADENMYEDKKKKKRKEEIK
jgi:diguanylate cyclase (GGDEF)-like protein/PAS domain S-box-containing protein